MHRLLFGYLELYQSYLPGGGLYVNNSTGSDNMYYILTDYQGNWNKVIAEDGSTVEEYSFDPWGRRRNPSDWSYSSLPTSFLFDRGYTGHEYLDDFGLINMNGRVYDPIVARFLSPDNFVSTPFSSQGFNRYSYGFNNPLLYSDPDGELPIVAALLYVAIQGVIQGDMASRNGGNFWEGFAWGAGTAGVGMGVGAVIGPVSSNLGFFSGAANAMVPAAIGGTITYGLQSLVYGSSFNWQGLGWNVGLAGLMGGVEGFHSANYYNKHFVGPLEYGHSKAISVWNGRKSHVPFKFKKEEALNAWSIYSRGKVWESTNTAKIGGYGVNKNRPGYTEPTYSLGVKSLGGKSYGEGWGTEVRFSRKFVKRFWYDPRHGYNETFPHEDVHITDYYTGLDSYYQNMYDYNTHHAIMEYRAYSFQNTYYGTGSMPANVIPTLNIAKIPLNSLLKFHPWAP